MTQTKCCSIFAFWVMVDANGGCRGIRKRLRMSLVPRHRLSVFSHCRAQWWTPPFPRIQEASLSIPGSVARTPFPCNPRLRVLLLLQSVSLRDWGCSTWPALSVCDADFEVLVLEVLVFDHFLEHLGLCSRHLRSLQHGTDVAHYFPVVSALTSNWAVLWRTRGRSGRCCQPLQC